MSSIEQTSYNAHVIQLNNEHDIRKELSNIKADKKAYDILIQKMVFLHVKLEQVDTRAANMLKQHLRSIGGEAVISKEAYSFTERTTDVLLSASKETFRLLTKKLNSMPYGLGKISKELEKSLFSNYGIMNYRDKTLDFRHKTYVMGILRFDKISRSTELTEEGLLEKINAMVKSGVDIIDIYVDDNIENIRNREDEKNKTHQLITLLNLINSKYPDLILSITTTKYNIAKEALNAGVDILIEAVPLKYNEQMLHLVAQKKCPIVLMHNNSFLTQAPKPLTSISDVIRDIQSNISFAVGQGILRDKIIIEPGIGFGRSKRDNFLILKQLSSFKYLNVPILVGLSKHSFLGEALRGKMRKTQISSITANTMAIINGANIIRVDDVSQAVTVANIIDTLKNIEEDI